MKVNLINNESVIITLSKRNLLALLDMVDDPYAQKTIYKHIDQFEVCVIVEPDDIHYGDNKPGEMSPKTEKFIKEHQ